MRWPRGKNRTARAGSCVPFWGPKHSAVHGADRARAGRAGSGRRRSSWKKGGELQLSPAWLSRNMWQADPVRDRQRCGLRVWNGEDASAGDVRWRVVRTTRRRIGSRGPGHATLYALDALTGAELWSSGDQIASFSHFQQPRRSPTAASISVPTTARCIASASSRQRGEVAMRRTSDPSSVRCRVLRVALRVMAARPEHGVEGHAQGRGGAEWTTSGLRCAAQRLAARRRAAHEGRRAEGRVPRSSGR